MRYLVDEHGNVVFVREPENAGRGLGQKTQKQSRPLFQCPRCNATVRRSRLDHHLKSVHAASLSEIEALGQSLPVAASRVAPSHAGDQTRPTGTSLKQATSSGGRGSDGQDGSRHIGQFAREEGRFGSMPKYDDYSEEGSPD